MTGTLIVCGTPIGNLADAPPRLAEALGRCDVIFAEDTRRTATLLASLGVARPVRSYFVGNERRRSEELADRLARGETVALVTDAGMPGLSDPGLSAVAAARQVGAAVTVVPGPSAVTTALAVSGLPADRFVFEGFLPRSGAGRRGRLEALASEPRTIVLFLVPHRALADLEDLSRALGPHRTVCACRELTKLHEEVVLTTLGEAAKAWREDDPKGEITLVVAGSPPSTPDPEAAFELAESLLAEGLRPSEAARRAAAETGVDRRRIYRRLVGAEVNPGAEPGRRGRSPSP